MTPPLKSAPSGLKCRVFRTGPIVAIFGFWCLVAGGDGTIFVEADPADLPQVGKTFGGTWADLNGDGRLDLFLSRHGAGAEIYFDGPQLGFRRRDLPVGLPSGPPDNHGGAACDVDGDGDWDIFVVAGTDRGRDSGCNALMLQEAPSILVDAIGCDHLLGDGGGRGRAGLWLELDGDRTPELLLLNYRSPPRLFHFDGAGWTDWTPRVTLEHPADPSGMCWYNTAVACDFDRDGRTDLFAASGDRVLWRNEAGCQLRDVTARAGLQRAGPMLVSSATGDVDGDGDPDLLTAMRAPAWITVWINESDSEGIRFVPGPEFVRLSPYAEIDSIVLEDLDSDGVLDLYVALLDHYDNLPNLAWSGRGDGTFAPAPDAWGAAAAVPALPAGTWALDLDHDGDLDLSVIHGRENFADRTGGVVLFENRTPLGGFTLTLESRDGPVHGLGAVVVLQLPERTLVRQVHSTLSFWNGAVLPVHFGVGHATGPFAVEIHWPGGRRQDITVPQPGRAYRLIEGDSEPTVIPSG